MVFHERKLKCAVIAIDAVESRVGAVSFVVTVQQIFPVRGEVALVTFIFVDFAGSVLFVQILVMMHFV